MISGSFHLVASAADAGLRVDQFVARKLPDLSRSQIQRLIRSGHVRGSNGALKPASVIASGVTLDIDIPAAAAAIPQPENLPIEILHNDSAIVVVNKPAGIVVHPSAGHAGGTLVNALLHHVRGLSGVGGTERPGIVHRLDRGTSGVMVIAKHDAAHRELARQFHDREVEKEYVALVWGTIAPGTRLDRPIGRDPKHRRKMSGRSGRGRPALTEISKVKPLRGVSLVHIRLGTGRTHQIRVHLSDIGHAVVGDDLYGGTRKRYPADLAALATLDRPFLHAARLTLTHPSTGERMTFEAALPEDLTAVIDKIGSC